MQSHLSQAYIDNILSYCIRSIMIIYNVIKYVFYELVYYLLNVIYESY